MLSRHSAFAKRAQSAAAAVRTIEEKISKLPNGLTVASVDLEGAASQLVIAFRAGSRYEDSNEKGLVHHARVMAGTDTHKFKSPLLLWNTAANGGSLSATSTRDVLALQLSVVRDNVPVALSLLGEVAGQTSYEPWVVEDSLPFVKADNAHKCQRAVAVEDLHRAAYRNGPLAQSTYASHANIGKIKYQQLQNFHAKHMVSGNAVLVGVNVPHDQLVNYASELAPITEGPAVQPKASEYFGGEFRRDTGANQVVIALAGKGASLQKVEDVAVQAVLAEIISSTKIAGASVEPLSIQYSDSGLVGAVLRAPKDAAGAVLKKLASALKGLSTDEAVVNANKRKAAVRVLVASESASNVALDTAVSLLASENAISPADLADAISKVSGSQVAAALKTATGKLSLAAVGDLSSVPYLDEL